MRVFTILFLYIAFLTISCSPQKSTTNNYLLNVSDTTVIDSLPLPKAVIRKGDLLSIRVYSTAVGSRPEVDAPYNLPDAGSGAGFLVDGAGNIDYPQLGTMKVEGLTKDELAAIIKQRLQGQLSQPSVIVRFINYRITVLGEVGAPSTFTIPTERITILEALGLAGDITEYGRKDNVKIIREVNNERQIGNIDLTSDDMFNSPFYVLQQNDVVLVDETRRKRKQEDQQLVVQQIGIATSIITAVALILNLIK
jgi:polysaccharide export outer membrane protein